MKDRSSFTRLLHTLLLIVLAVAVSSGLCPLSPVASLSMAEEAAVARAPGADDLNSLAAPAKRVFIYHPTGKFIQPLNAFHNRRQDGGSADPGQPIDLVALHRSDQTFLIWHETTNLSAAIALPVSVRAVIVTPNPTRNATVPPAPESKLDQEPKWWPKYDITI